MGKEIERKFLVKGDFPKDNPSKIVQAYLSFTKELAVRVRIENKKATLAIKSGEEGITRYEFEYEIPMVDAEQLLMLTIGNEILKTRHRSQIGNHIWEVDVFHGRNEGLVVAEIELLHEKEKFIKPDWIGEEISGQSKYGNAMLSIHPFKEW